MWQIVVNENSRSRVKMPKVVWPSWKSGGLRVTKFRSFGAKISELSLSESPIFFLFNFSKLKSSRTSGRSESLQLHTIER